ncbi:MAG: hypothetical protein H0U27_12310 [Nitrosopumilus sp.]|nr:hypothetical protein [Nitrosopumilus sp.]
MNPVFPENIYTVYQNDNVASKSYLCEEPIENYEIMVSNIIFKYNSLINNKNCDSGIRNIKIEEYIFLKNNCNLAKDEEKKFTFNSVFINESYNKNIISLALKEIRSNSLNSCRGDFLLNCIERSTSGENYDKIRNIEEFNKCKLLIESGEDVNLIIGDYSDMTCLEHALTEKLDDSLIELLICAGGITYSPINYDQRNRVNVIMQPIIKKVKILQKMFAVGKSNIDVLPKELKSIIGSNAIDNLAPKVFQKIMAIS